MRTCNGRWWYDAKKMFVVLLIHWQVWNLSIKRIGSGNRAGCPHWVDKITCVMASFLPSLVLRKVCLIDGGHICVRSCQFMIEFCISVLQDYIPNLVLTESDTKTLCHITVFHNMQISKKIHYGNVYCPRAFFVEHIELNLSVSNFSYYRKLRFWALITVSSSDQLAHGLFKFSFHLAKFHFS